MNRFESINLIEVFEIDEIELFGLKNEKPKIKITEHWNNRRFVNIGIDGKSFTILADELKRAVDNAQNAHAC